MGNRKGRLRNPYKKANTVTDYKSIMFCLPWLTETQKEILSMRRGYNGYTPSTYEAIAKTYGLTKQRIHALEQQIYAKMEVIITNTKKLNEIISPPTP